MMINILNNSGKYVASFIILAVSVSLVIFIQQKIGLGNGYQYISNHADELHIKKDGKTIVGASMVDLDVVSNYVVGLRLPSRRFECDDGASLRIIMDNKKDYFILNTDNGTLLHYNSKIAFEEKLQELNINSKVSLDYSKFITIWNKYSKSYVDMDLSACKLLH